MSSSFSGRYFSIHISSFIFDPSSQGFQAVFSLQDCEGRISLNLNPREFQLNGRNIGKSTSFKVISLAIQSLRQLQRMNAEVLCHDAFHAALN